MYRATVYHYDGTIEVFEGTMWYVSHCVPDIEEISYYKGYDIISLDTGEVMESHWN